MPRRSSSVARRGRPLRGMVWDDDRGRYFATVHSAPPATDAFAPYVHTGAKRRRRGHDDDNASCSRAAHGHNARRVVPLALVLRHRETFGTPAGHMHSALAAARGPHVEPVHFSPYYFDVHWGATPYAGIMTYELRKQSQLNAVTCDGGMVDRGLSEYGCACTIDVCPAWNVAEKTVRRAVTRSSIPEIYLCNDLRLRHDWGLWTRRNKNGGYTKLAIHDDSSGTLARALDAASVPNDYSSEGAGNRLPIDRAAWADVAGDFTGRRGVALVMSIERRVAVYVALAFPFAAMRRRDPPVPLPEAGPAILAPLGTMHGRVNALAALFISERRLLVFVGTIGTAMCALTVHIDKHGKTATVVDSRQKAGPANANHIVCLTHLPAMLVSCLPDENSSDHFGLWHCATGVQLVAYTGWRRNHWHNWRFVVDATEAFVYAPTIDGHILCWPIHGGGGGRTPPLWRIDTGTERPLCPLWRWDEASDNVPHLDWCQLTLDNGQQCGALCVTGKFGLRYYCYCAPVVDNVSQCC